MRKGKIFSLQTVKKLVRSYDTFRGQVAVDQEEGVARFILLINLLINDNVWHHLVNSSPQFFQYFYAKCTHVCLSSTNSCWITPLASKKAVNMVIVFDLFT